jgi:hypothetical protein
LKSAVPIRNQSGDGLYNSTQFLAMRPVLPPKCLKFGVVLKNCGVLENPLIRRENVYRIVIAQKKQTRGKDHKPRRPQMYACSFAKVITATSHCDLPQETSQSKMSNPVLLFPNIGVPADPQHAQEY